LLSNLRNLGMAAEDGPWFSGRSVLLGSMLRPPRHRRWPHRGRSLLLANPPRTAPRGQGPPPFPVESPPIMSLCIIESLPMCCSIQLAISSHQPGEEVVETEARESVPIH